MSDTPAPAAPPAMAREPGHYWVRPEGTNHGPAEMCVAEYNNAGLWYLTGVNHAWLDSDFAEIGPRIPAPDEAPASPAPADPALAERLETLTKQAMEEDTKRNHLLVSMAVIDDLPTILSALRATPDAGDGWREIESAPRDGTQIEACSISDTTGGLRCIVDWDPSEEHPEQAWAQMDGLTYHKDAFTHWRPLCPLPQPPATTAGEDGR